MTEQRRGRGRPPASNPREVRTTVRFTPAEWAEIEAAASALAFDAASYVRSAALRWTRSQVGRYERYVDSGQQERDEAAEWASEMAEATVMIESGEIAVVFPPRKET